MAVPAAAKARQAASSSAAKRIVGGEREGERGLRKGEKRAARVGKAFGAAEMRFECVG